MGGILSARAILGRLLHLTHSGPKLSDEAQN